MSSCASTLVVWLCRSASGRKKRLYVCSQNAATRLKPLPWHSNQLTCVSRMMRHHSLSRRDAGKFLVWRATLKPRLNTCLKCWGVTAVLLINKQGTVWGRGWHKCILFALHPPLFMFFLFLFSTFCYLTSLSVSLPNFLFATLSFCRSVPCEVHKWNENGKKFPVSSMKRVSHPSNVTFSSDGTNTGT